MPSSMAMDVTCCPPMAPSLYLHAPSSLVRSPHRTSPHRTSPHRTSPRLTSPHLTFSSPSPTTCSVKYRYPHHLRTRFMLTTFAWTCARTCPYPCTRPRTCHAAAADACPPPFAPRRRALRSNARGGRPPLPAISELAARPNGVPAVTSAPKPKAEPQPQPQPQP